MLDSFRLALHLMLNTLALHKIMMVYPLSPSLSSAREHINGNLTLPPAIP